MPPGQIFEAPPIIILALNSYVLAFPMIRLCLSLTDWLAWQRRTAPLRFEIIRAET